MGNILGVCGFGNDDVDHITIPNGPKGEKIIQKRMRSIPGVISLYVAQLSSPHYRKKGVFNAIAALELVLESRNGDRKFFNSAMQKAVEKVSWVDMEMGERLRKSFVRLTGINLKKILKKADETAKDGMDSIKKAENLGNLFDDRLKDFIDKSRDDRIDPVEIEAVMERNLAPQHCNITSSPTHPLMRKCTLEDLKRDFIRYKDTILSFIRVNNLNERTALQLMEWWDQIEMLYEEFDSKHKDILKFIDTKKLNEITAAGLYKRLGAM